AALSLQSDSQGRVVQVADASDTGSGRTVRYTWSGAGASSQLAQVTDVLGHTWKYEYNAQGQITRRVDPLGASIELQYMTSPAMIPDSPGFAGMGAGGGTGGGGALASSGTGATKVSAPQIARVASYRDESGARTNYRIEWDRVRQQYTVHTQEPSGLQRTQIYNKDGLILSDSAGGLRSLQRSVDSASQERLTDARGLITTIEYNAARQPIRTIHPDGSVETNAYDSQGRRTSHTNALGQTSRWRYDAQGSVIQHTEAEGAPEQRTTVSAYDPYGQLKSRTRGAGDGQGPDAVTERFEYDKRGNLIQRTDGLGRTSQASYNSQGQPLSQTNALNQTTRLSYDAAGNLLTVTNPLGQTLSHAYDARGRRTQTTTAEGKVQRTRYNAGGQVIEVIAPGQREGSGLRTGYDSAGRPVKTTSAGGLATTTAYDSLGRISQTTDPAGNVTTYEYGPEGSPLAGLLTAVNYPTYKETYQYDQRNRQTAVTQHLGQGQTRVQRQAYDAAGQRISATDPAGHSTLYQYDALGRLTQTTDALGGTTKQSWDAHEQLTSLT
ncbi:RHS repeat protein, partial [Comamonadaceae bacterium OH2545_COT-014]